MKKLFLLFYLVSIASLNAQIQPKLKWKDFLGSWDSQDILDKNKGLNTLSFVRHKADAKMDSVQCSWKFEDNNLLYYIKKNPAGQNDTTQLNWYFVKDKTSLQIRQLAGNGSFFMMKEMWFAISEMQNDRLKIQLLEKKP